MKPGTRDVGMHPDVGGGDVDVDVGGGDMDVDVELVVVEVKLDEGAELVFAPEEVVNDGDFRLVLVTPGR